MPFTEKEVRRWHEEKARREQHSAARIASPPVATCVSCQRPFGVCEGVVTEEAAICDICNGD